LDRVEPKAVTASVMKRGPPIVMIYIQVIAQ